MHPSANPTPNHQCPCCDYYTLSQRGMYFICPVCFWEDDGQDIDELDEPSAPNHGITLRQGRANFVLYGACEPEMVRHVLTVEARRQFKLWRRAVE